MEAAPTPPPTHPLIFKKVFFFLSEVVDFHLEGTKGHAQQHEWKLRPPPPPPLSSKSCFFLHEVVDFHLEGTKNMFNKMLLEFAPV